MLCNHVLGTPSYFSGDAMESGMLAVGLKLNPAPSQENLSRSSLGKALKWCHDVWLMRRGNRRSKNEEKKIELKRANNNGDKSGLVSPNPTPNPAPFFTSWHSGAIPRHLQPSSADIEVKTFNKFRRRNHSRWQRSGSTVISRSEEIHVLSVKNHHCKMLADTILLRTIYKKISLNE